MSTLGPELRKLSYPELRQHYTDLVSRNVGGVQPGQIERIVRLILGETDLNWEPNFWHCVSMGMDRLDQCPCEDCIDKRWRPQYQKE